MAPDITDPYADYEIDDWQWEFLRRNPRYRRLYKAIKRAEERGWGYEHNGEYQFLDEIWALDLRSRLSLSCPPTIDNPDESGDPVALPSPDIPRNKFKYSPVRRGGAYITNFLASDDDMASWAEGVRDLRFMVDAGVPENCKIYVEIDVRCKLETILKDLRKELPAYLYGGRDRLNKYKAYLDVWDLNAEKFTNTQIAKKLWPEDYEKAKSNRAFSDQKNKVLQSVHDHLDAANKLIESSFPAKKRTPKTKKLASR